MQPGFRRYRGDSHFVGFRSGARLAGISQITIRSGCSGPVPAGPPLNDDRLRPRHPIQVAARRAGLNPALLRAWERRYQAVRPSRSETRQRLYSDQDVERLRRLRIVTDAGRRISEVAALGDEQLAVLLSEDAAQHRALTPAGVPGRPSLEQLLGRALARVRDRDERGLRRELERAVLLYDPLLFLDEVLGALVERGGSAWADRTLDPSHEHVTSIVVRALLEDLLVRLQPDHPQARVAVAVPAGERHELGGFALSVALAVCGCDGLRLGAELPPNTIVRLAHEQSVEAVALSVTWEGDTRRLEEELLDLRRALDPSVQMIVGGWGSRRLERVIERIGAVAPTRLQELPRAIDRMLDHAQERRPRRDEFDDQSIAS